MNLPLAPLDLDVLLDRVLQTGNETDGFDFKEQLDFQNSVEHKIKMLRAIGAFSNTDKGGHIIIGVSNDRRVVGLSAALAATYDQTPIQRMAGEYFAPSPAVQVRHHARDGKKLVFIEVKAFQEIPSVVINFLQLGKEKLQEGTFLVRTGAAESAVLSTEVELRKLCDAIAVRRAKLIGDMIQRGQGGEDRALRNSLLIIKAEVERMSEHAQQLNGGLAHGYAEGYLPLLFRPLVMAEHRVQILAHIQRDKTLLDESALLEGAAAAADREAEKLLAGGGDARRLTQHVRTVLSSSRLVLPAIERILERPTPA